MDVTRSSSAASTSFHGAAGAPTKRWAKQNDEESPSFSRHGAPASHGRRVHLRDTEEAGREESSQIPLGSDSQFESDVDSDLNVKWVDRFKIPQNLINYTLSLPLQPSQRQLQDIQKQFQLWATWDDLESLAGHQSVVRTLVNILKDTLPQDSRRAPEAIAEQISNAMSQDAQDIHKLFASILRHEETCKAFLGCRGDVAQHLLDLLQDLLDLFPESRDRPLLSQGLMRLFKASHLHPACFPLADVQAEGYQMAGGSFGDIFQGLVLGQNVAIKMMRVFGMEVKTAVKRFGREAVIWRQLSHPNVLPFFGMYHTENRLCLVSPWMSNGHVMAFLRNAPPNSNTERISLILDVALGLEYLHRKHIVHGDLKGANILVTPSGRACVADFGLSSIIATSLKFQQSTTTTRGGTTRYQAPELLNSAEAQNHFGSDIYAFACVGYEILTDKNPFFEIKNEMYLVGQVLKGLRPSRPETISAEDGLWLLLQDCWNEEPTKRPRAIQIVERLRAPPISAKEANSSTDWDETSSARFRRSLQDRLILPSVATIQQMISLGDAPIDSRPRKRKIESVYSVSPSPLTSDSEAEAESNTSKGSTREPKNPNRPSSRPVQSATPDGRAFTMNARIVIPRLSNPEVYSRSQTSVYPVPRQVAKSESPVVPPHHYKLYAISSSPSTHPYEPTTAYTPIPPFSGWRHPDELAYIGSGHPDAGTWTDVRVVTYMVDNAFSIPSRNAASASWVKIKVQADGGDVVTTTLPRGYRIPLLWLGKVQWDCLKLLLTTAREQWPALRFDVLHIARLAAEFMAKARKEVKMKRQYRNVMIDRALSRFFDGWMGSRDEFVWDFYCEFMNEEYKDDMLRRNWQRKAVIGIQGFAVTDHELNEGITAEQFMEGLNLDRERGTYEWIDPAAPAPSNDENGGS
ncbi:hypothetical protein B0H16DRAFT_233408 [Mycena metata]|uniref:Protein kinase domain-containing protein n=1 Tax=Mycena metata TaxID=1033252 RepID=A0AAD7HUW3_9AGAR|nr:hypothetical protein B0H16DRAFT_233408 [Mycena metata]